MGPWRGAWAMGVCLALAGCGSSDPTPGPETPSGSERSIPNPDPDVPEETPPANTGSPSPLEATTPTLPARACIPWATATAPVRATACASRAVFADGTSQSTRYDADSHPLEVRTFTASGELSKVETQVWRRGLLRLERSEKPDGTFTQKEWIYDAQSRLQQRVFSSKESTPHGGSFDFIYDDQGHISQVIGHGDYEQFQATYKYNVAGQLVSIDNASDCGFDETRCSTLSYWPNGRLKQEDWDKYRIMNYDSYNELGQLITSKVINDQTGTVTTRAYDSAGRLVRLRESYSASGASTDTHIETLTSTENDPAGQRERFAQDNRKDCLDNDCGPNQDQAQWTDFTRVTRRSTFFCDTQIVALDEWDGNEDGKVDAQRTHERDASGRLAREVSSGAAGLDKGPVSLDFQYSCP